jgi:hypothetical protein
MFMSDIVPDEETGHLSTKSFPERSKEDNILFIKGVVHLNCDTRGRGEGGIWRTLTEQF